jgi:hypothetical protein
MKHARMVASVVCWLALALAGLAGEIAPAPSPAATPVATPPPAPRERILAEAAKLLGTTEATGRNDGEAVDRFLATVGLKGSRAPWCAAVLRYIFDAAGLRTIGPRSAWSPDWVRNATWTRANGGKTPLPGDVAGIFFPSKGRIAHVVLILKWGPSVRTYEGNTSPDAAPGSAADREGGGFWSKRRLQSQIHSARNWLD